MLNKNVSLENIDEEIVVTIEKKPETKFEEYLLGLFVKEFFDSQYQWIKQFEIDNGDLAINALDEELSEEYNHLGYILSVTGQEANSGAFIAEGEDTFPF